jgi:hypothetical protein
VNNRAQCCKGNVAVPLGDDLTIFAWKKTNLTAKRISITPLKQLAVQRGRACCANIDYSSSGMPELG